MTLWGGKGGTRPPSPLKRGGGFPGRERGMHPFKGRLRYSQTPLERVQDNKMTLAGGT